MLYALVVTDVYLVGLGVTVALVVYPSFHLVGAGQWVSYHRSHVRRIGLAVAPAWLVQGVGSLWWLAHAPHRGPALLHALLALGAVLITVTGAVPRHARLERRHDGHDIRQLQTWHWVRTALWVGCALLALGSL